MLAILDVLFINMLLSIVKIICHIYNVAICLKCLHCTFKTC